MTARLRRRLEGALLGLVGGAIGGGIAAFVMGWNRFSMSMEGVNIEVSGDPTLAVLGTAIAIGLGLLAGAIPAVRATTGGIVNGLRAT